MRLAPIAMWQLLARLPRQLHPQWWTLCRRSLSLSLRQLLRLDRLRLAGLLRL